MLQHHLADSIHRDCLYKVPVCYGQLVQPQRGSYQVGWRRGPKMCLWSPTTTCWPSSPIWSTLGPRGRQPALRRWPLHIHCDGLASEQNLPTIQRNPCIPSSSSAVMDYQELTPFITKNTSWCALAPIHSLPLQRSPQPHHAQRHRTFQTTLSRCHLSQWRQASYIPADLLSGALLPVPHHHLRRPFGVSQIGGKPQRHHREDHRRDQQAIWQVIPMGPWGWPWSTERLCPAQTKEAVQSWTTNS